MCFDSDCKDNSLDRRTFLYGGAAALVGLSTYQEKQRGDTSPPTRVMDQPGVQQGTVVFKHGGVNTIDGFLARPAKDGTFLPVLVIAGNRITEEYIPNTCVALALAGFVGLAPNIFHTLPDTARTPAEMRAATRDHTDLDVLQDIQVAADFLKTQPFVNSSAFGVIGFCYGGRMALLWGARFPEVGAVVAFHPGVTSAAEVSRLRAPVQLHHGTADHSVDAVHSKQLELSLRAQGTPVELYLYEGADHGFLAYTRPYYHADDATLAWKRAAGFLQRHLPR